jgi:hypothetical protein
MQRRGRFFGLVGAALLAAAVLSQASAAAGARSRALVRFTDAGEDAARFLRYSQQYKLTPGQQALKDRVLTKIPAPCCKEYSIATCCCPCNLAKTVWGLSNWLIVEKDANAPELDAAVRGWLRHVNPKGFSGDLCYTGGCGRAFADNGCGGMHESALRVWK